MNVADNLFQQPAKLYVAMVFNLVNENNGIGELVSFQCLYTYFKVRSLQPCSFKCITHTIHYICYTLYYAIHYIQFNIHIYTIQYSYIKLLLSVLR